MTIFVLCLGIYWGLNIAIGAYFAGTKQQFEYNVPTVLLQSAFYIGFFVWLLVLVA